MQKLSEFIKALREESGHTQLQLANALCISRSTYSNYENGHRLPDINILSKLAAFYNVALENFSFETHTYAQIYKEYMKQRPDLHHIDAIILNSDELELVIQYRKLEPKKKESVFPYLVSLSSID